MHKKGIYERYFKRVLDIICGIVAIVVFWWLYLLLAILVRIKLGKPVLFVQERPGKNGKIFKLCKFRTMTDEKDENGKLLPDMARLTKFGKFLRNSSLDELPEVINILRGEMSIIGPRPLLIKYLPLYNEKQRRRHEVRPGMSGYAQTHGRNATSWEERFDMDVYYVDHITFLGDIKIIIDTVLSVLKREGIDSSETSTVTMEEFKGTGTE
ncbi:sugar transferase [Coprococcus sp. AM25-15LB]|nr:sugar transferase [Coprococcus sp. AM25-15LB]RJW09809.1 sugar transferase [Coprococcus sp. AM25-4LB]